MEPIPFHQWKQETVAKEWAAGRVHEKWWYVGKYGAYCANVRRPPAPPRPPINEVR